MLLYDLLPYNRLPSNIVAIHIDQLKDNPSYCLPQENPSETKFEARKLAHQIEVNNLSHCHWKYDCRRTPIQPYSLKIA